MCWESVDVEGQLYALIYVTCIGDLSIRGFEYSGGSWNQCTTDTEGQLKFWGSQKFDCMGRWGP